MVGYLDQYGAGEERREKIVKTVVISLAALAVVGGSLFFVFHNYREERLVKQFFERLATRDYKTAYAMFGCTDEKPCRDYRFDKFMEDWGPKSGRGDPSNFRISRSRPCGACAVPAQQIHEPRVGSERSRDGLDIRLSCS